jgi:hypothetical protein
MERPRVRIGRAVVTTTVVLWLLEWLSAGPIGLEEALAIALWVSAVLGALTVAVHRLDRRRLPVGYQLLALALVAGTVSSSVHVAFLLVAAAAPELVSDESSRSLAATAAIGFFDGDALFGFWALLAELPRRIGAERRLEEERHALRQEAELARIRAALEPHFVLNTLNTIAGLVTSEPREARMLIGTLGDLLRDTMPESQRPYHSVRDEVSWLRGFARIVSSRHRGKLVFEWEVDRSVEDWLLPTLLLQPLLENAVQHGALRRLPPGRVLLSIAGDGGRLRCAVEDDGPGFRPETARAGGRGLELVRRRLALESADASLEIASAPGRTRAELVLPGRMT